MNTAQPQDRGSGGRLRLPRCEDCHAVQYPPREICHHCLGERIRPVEVSPLGRLLSWTELHASVEPFFRERLPWPVALVALDCGPVVFAHLATMTRAPGERVRLSCRRDVHGRDVLVATGPEVGTGDAGFPGLEALLVPDSGQDDSAADPAR